MHLLKKVGDVEGQEEYTHPLCIQIGLNHQIPASLLTPTCAALIKPLRDAEH